MEERRGEKIGWIGGFAGGIIWIFLLSVFWLFLDKVWVGIIGLVLFGVGMFSILRFTPWRYPKTRYFLLMLPAYIVTISALVLFAVWGWNIFETDFPLWSLWFLAPMLGPFITIGWRSWDSFK